MKLRAFSTACRAANFMIDQGLPSRSGRARPYAHRVALVGRARELAEVARLLDRAVAGAGGLLVVTGSTGAGKTALTDAAAVLARERGLPVVRATGVRGDSGPLIWDQLIGDLGAGEPAAGPAEPDADDTARTLADGGPRLLIVDDLDRAGQAAAEVLALLAPRLGSGATAVLVTGRDSPGVPPELRLTGLTRADLAGLTPGLPEDACYAVWLASAGVPGIALALASELAAHDSTVDAVVRLALTVPSRAEFLNVDVTLVRLLEAATVRPLNPAVRARLLARLARELLGDASASARRRELVDEAVALARMSGDPGVLAEVLDSRLHALWDPAAAHERLAVASEIVTHARAAGDDTIERRGLFWRFTALVELGDLDQAEAALVSYARAAEAAGDAEAAVVVLARQAMLAIVRGRFGDAESLARAVAVRGRQAGLADTARLVGALDGGVAVMRGHAASVVDVLSTLARQMPGHFYEASLARVLVEAGRTSDASVELERLLPAVLSGSGPRWLGAVADLAFVASVTGELAAALALYGTLLPYRGRLVVWGGANTITGPVDGYLGRLATRLGRFDQAVSHLDSAIGLEERIGALPGLASSLAARAAALEARGRDGDRTHAAEDLRRARSIGERLGMLGLLATLDPPPNEWRLDRDGDDWLLEAGPESARLRDARGMRYLRALLAAPGQEIAALDLVAGGSGLRASDGDPLLDETARVAYRRRIQTLDEQLDAADRAGDAERAAAVHAERAVLITELRRAGGLGGRPRAHASEAERARVNVTRTLWAAVEKVESAAPRAGAHLRASLRTGRACRYQPDTGGPARWRV